MARFLISLLISTPLATIRYSTGRASGCDSETSGILVISTQETPYLLAIESGGSGTRVALAGADGGVLHLERCASGSCLYRDPEGFSATFGAALARVLAAAVPHRDAIVLAGLAGPMDEDLVAGQLAKVLPGVPHRYYTEGDIARGLYGITAGIALIAGTGCSCSAVDETGALTSFGGYGPQFGDEGSAYWIGCEGLKGAFLAEQHRIEDTALLDAARAFFKVESPWGIHQEAEGTGHVAAPWVASFASEVNRAAEAFDRRAMKILDEAGAHLGRLVLDTAERARLETEPVPLVMTGGALRSARVVAAIERTLAGSTIAFSHFPLVHEPIQGLIHLLQRSNEARTLDDVS